MANIGIGIGELIRINREEKELTQETLCFGICTPGTLSKIENGTQTPSRATFNALMERMGLSAGVYPSFLNPVDKKAYELQHDFNEWYAKGDYDKTEEILSKLKKVPSLDSVYEQFIQMAEILIRQQRKEISPAEAVKAFERVIELFFQDFPVEKIRLAVLTKTEINVLNAYAIAHNRAGNHDIAINVLQELIIYIESKVYDQESFAIVYTKLLYNLSKYVGMTGNDDDAVFLCEKGIRHCVRYNRYTHFAQLLYNKGYGLMNLGREDEACKCIQEAYYITRAMGKASGVNIERVRKYADEKGIKLL